RQRPLDPSLASLAQTEDPDAPQTKHPRRPNSVKLFAAVPGVVLVCVCLAHGSRGVVTRRCAMCAFLAATVVLSLVESSSNYRRELQSVIRRSVGHSMGRLMGLFRTWPKWLLDATAVAV